MGLRVSDESLKIATKPLRGSNSALPEHGKPVRMHTILKSTGKSRSGKTFYFTINVPENVVTVKAGTLCGTSSKEFDSIENIGWMYNFGKKYFSITKNGKYKLAEYLDAMKKYINS